VHVTLATIDRDVLEKMGDVTRGVASIVLDKHSREAESPGVPVRNWFSSRHEIRS
jgi:hypothetical protein